MDDEFHFTLDAAASDKSAKCAKYYTRETDGLAHDWSGETVFCNPPYGKETKLWVKKCYEESLKGTTVVMLIPARTDTSYWHDFIFGKADVRFLRGRLRFIREDGTPGDSAPFPSAVVIFKGVK